MVSLKKILISSIFVALVSTATTVAEVGRKTPDYTGALSAGPYYNPASKSYFELFKMQITPGMQSRWFGARELAEKQYFKKTKGHLAIIRDLETHQFILKNFSGRHYWIGLQYFCASKTMKWVDGSDATQSDFTAWDSQWARRSDIRCASRNYMPVHYTIETPTKALRWKASGSNKGFRMYLVEYPTGGE